MVFTNCQIGSFQELIRWKKNNTKFSHANNLTRDIVLSKEKVGFAIEIMYKNPTIVNLLVTPTRWITKF